MISNVLDKTRLLGVLLFGVGFFYYLLTPYLSFLLIGDFYQYTPIEASLPYISLNTFDLAYFVDLSVVFFSFLGGYFAIGASAGSCAWQGKERFWRTLSAIESPDSLEVRVLFVLVLLFASLFSLFLVYEYIKHSDVWFSGYRRGFDLDFLGKLSAITFLSAFFYSFFWGINRKIALGGLLVVNSVILLSFGSRNIFLVCVLTLILSGVLTGVMKITKWIAGGCLILVTFLLFVGLWRTGYEYKFNTLIGMFLSEPLFVASSSARFFEEYGGRPVSGNFNDTRVFINLMTSNLFSSEKKLLMDSLLHDKFAMAPFGASSLLLNMYYNFGYFYPIYLFVVGVYYGVLRSLANKSRIFLVIYASALSLLPFHFFNQHLFAFLKLLLFNTLAFPLVIILTVVAGCEGWRLLTLRYKHSRMGR